MTKAELHVKVYVAEETNKALIKDNDELAQTVEELRILVRSQASFIARTDPK